jgi:hypothetical protein
MLAGSSLPKKILAGSSKVKSKSMSIFYPFLNVKVDKTGLVFVEVSVHSKIRGV